MISLFVFMKHCFDFKGITTRGEFFMCLVSYAIWGTLIRIIESVFWMFFLDLSPETASYFSVFALFGTIAMYSMACRRLRHAGYSEKTLKWITFPFGPTFALVISFLPHKIQVKK